MKVRKTYAITLPRISVKLTNICSIFYIITVQQGLSSVSLGVAGFLTVFTVITPPRSAVVIFLSFIDFLS